MLVVECGACSPACYLLSDWLWKLTHFQEINHLFATCLENSVNEPAALQEPPEEAPPAEEAAAGLPSGRRNPPGGKSSLILG